MEPTQLDKIQEHYEAGKPIFQELFKLPDKELKEKLKELCGDNKTILTILNKGDCKRIIVNEIPNEIDFCFYDELKITWYGTVLVYEHGNNHIHRKFDKYFKL
jgi:hypothetical protein